MIYNIENITLSEMRNICNTHHRANKDCYSCMLYRFCGHDMIQRDPSAWRLSEEDYKNEEEER